MKRVFFCLLLICTLLLSACSTGLSVSKLPEETVYVPEYPVREALLGSWYCVSADGILQLELMADSTFTLSDYPEAKRVVTGNAAQQEDRLSLTALKQNRLPVEQVDNTTYGTCQQDGNLSFEQDGALLLFTRDLPPEATKGRLDGTWHAENGFTLVLNPDGTFHLTQEEDRILGVYRLEEPDISLTPQEINGTPYSSADSVLSGQVQADGSIDLAGAVFVPSN